MLGPVTTLLVKHISSFLLIDVTFESSHKNLICGILGGQPFISCFRKHQWGECFDNAGVWCHSSMPKRHSWWWVGVEMDPLNERNAKGRWAEELLSKVPHAFLHQTNLFNWNDWNVTIMSPTFLNSLPSWNRCCLEFTPGCFPRLPEIAMKSHTCHGEGKMMPRRQQQKLQGQLSRLVPNLGQASYIDPKHALLYKVAFFQTWQCFV